MRQIENKYYDELTKFIRTAVGDVVEETVAKTMLAIERTKGDAISQHQAEKEFGSGWLRQHIEAGLVEYTQSIPDDWEKPNNRKRTFSRAQLAELRRRESYDFGAYQEFVMAFRRVHEGYGIVDGAADGVQQIFLRERLIETQRRLNDVDERMAPPDQRKALRKQHKQQIKDLEDKFFGNDE